MLLQHDFVAHAIEAFEPLPATASRLASLLARSDWQLHEVEEAIALDQSLTPRLLALANSSLLSRGVEIGTVREAVMRLGAQAVVQVAMSLGMKRRLTRAIPQYGLSEGQLWTHSVASALGAQALIARRRGVLPPETFTAALMHDVGKLLLARFLDGENIDLLRRAQQAGTPLRTAELEILGLDHAEIGAAVAAHWKLPARVRVAIQYHHDPSQTSDPIASAVHLAELIGNRAERTAIGALWNDLPSEPQPAALERIGITADEVESLAAAVAPELSDVLRRYT